MIDLSKFQQSFNLSEFSRGIIDSFAGCQVPDLRSNDQCAEAEIDLHKAKEFEQWQQNECAILGCTTEEHDQLLQALCKMQSIGLPVNYEDLKGLILIENRTSLRIP